MYLSGAPLHVITMSLVERVRRARPQLPLSFSAGVDNRNFADCVALGLAPVTACSDLLKPGGYGRLPKYLDNLEARMRELGVRAVGDYVVKACGLGEQAVARVVPPSPLRDALLGSLGSGSVDLRAVLAGAGEEPRYEAIVAAAAALNTPLVRLAGHGRPALPERGAAAAAADRAAAGALRLHQLRQVPARLSERRELRAGGRAPGDGVRGLPRRARAGAAGRGRPLRGAREPPDRDVPGLLQRLRQLRHVLPGGRRPLPREAALLRLARGVAAPRAARRIPRRAGRRAAR